MPFSVQKVSVSAKIDNLANKTIVVIADTENSPCNITLVTPKHSPSQVIIKNTSLEGYDVTLDVTSGLLEHKNRLTPFIINPSCAATVVCDGENWWKVASFGQI